MKVFKLKYTQVIKSDINKVFDFFSDPENLSLITPKKLDFKILTPMPVNMREGQLIDYTIKVLKVRIRWRTIITEYVPKKKFIDQQLKGPYSMWHHSHEFIEKNGSVNMIDTIHYAMPFGFIGSFINMIWVRKDLDEIFKYRSMTIKKYFERKDN